MSKARSEKWLTDVSHNDPVGQVARAALSLRLAAVRRLLRQASTQSRENSECVHQLRVATRRAAAALGLYADLLPQHRAARLAKQLKRVRRAAGAVRDCDVLTQRLTGDRGPTVERLLVEVRSRRRTAQRLLRKTYRRMKKDGRFSRRIRRLLRRLSDRHEAKGSHFGTWAKSRLPPFLRKFFAAASAADLDASALHRFRIRAKELRYAMELLAPAFPLEFADALYPVVEAVQQKLGEINDPATARAHIRTWLGPGDSHGDGPGIQALLEREGVRIESAGRDFYQWWTPQRRAELEARFDALFTAGHELRTA